MTAEFRHRTRIEVQFRDIDAMGHVNNAVTASYVEQARVSYLHDLLTVDPFGEMELILAMVKIDYSAPIFFGQEVDIDTRVDWIGRSSIGMSHRLTAGADGHEVARADAVLVAYDYQQGRPKPVPDAWRSLLATHEGHALDRVTAPA